MTNRILIWLYIYIYIPDQRINNGKQGPRFCKIPPLGEQVSQASINYSSARLTGDTSNKLSMPQSCFTYLQILSDIWLGFSKHPKVNFVNVGLLHHRSFCMVIYQRSVIVASPEEARHSNSAGIGDTKTIICCTTLLWFAGFTNHCSNVAALVLSLSTVLYSHLVSMVWASMARLLAALLLDFFLIQ